MTPNQLVWRVLAVAIAAIACQDTTLAPDAGLAPSLHRESNGHRTVVVDPNGKHDATTIQAGIDLAPPGGKVLVKAGTYDERIVIRKGITLEGMSDGLEPVIIQQLLAAPLPPASHEGVIQVITTEPVAIRGIQVHNTGIRALANFTDASLPLAVHLTIQNASFIGDATSVVVINNAVQSGGRAKLDVFNNVFVGSGGSIAISLGGDVDARVEGNQVTPGAAAVRLSPTGLAPITVPAGAAGNLEVTHNDLILPTNPGSRAINIQGIVGTGTYGTVNIVGNTFHGRSISTPCAEAAIAYESYAGRIERNSIVGAVQDCAGTQGRGGPGAIRIGTSVSGIPPAIVSVRFNDIAGNAFAGLWVGRNQTTSLDARCNWWGSASGPSGAGLTGTGDAVVVEAGAAPPVVTPFATEAVAEEDRRGDDDHKHHRRHGREECSVDRSIVVTIEHRVPHISTVPANAGASVFLAVRERVRQGKVRHEAREAVLFIHGNTFPGVPGADLRVKNYSWMEALAKAGFDAFTMDHSGYGFSPRPTMDDPCNADPAQQTSILIPRPLTTTCSPSYAFRFATAQSEWDEIDRVVDHIRTNRGVERVHLIGWSRGGWRAASYAARHPEKVGKLLLLAPLYTSTESATPPAGLPQAGFPMTVATRAATYASLWTPGIQCEGQVEDGMQDAVWNATMEFDPLGKTWGPSDGVTRVRTFTYWGYNQAAAAAFTSSATLILSGDFDAVARNTDQLYSDLGTSEKLHVRVQCASHLVPWEIQAHNLHNLSIDFLRHGTIAGASQGKFVMDTQGNLSPRQ
jgi:pimeloyl-ACP methyl ester carboxylesterase